MRPIRGMWYVPVVVLVSAGLLPLLAQVGSPGGAAAGIGVYRRGFTVCVRESHGVSCQNYAFGPCGACHALKTNAVFDDKTEGLHRAKYWMQYQLKAVPDQQVQFGGVAVKFVSGAYVALSREGQKLASFPVGTNIIKAPNGSFWIFFPPKPSYYLSSKLEAAIKSGLETLK